MTVKRTILGEASYSLEEIFNNAEQAVDRNNQGENQKFTLLENNIQQVNIKPIKKGGDIEHENNNVQSTKDTTVESSAKYKGSANE